MQLKNVKYNPPIENRSEYLRLDFNENILPLPDDIVRIFRSIPMETIPKYPEYSSLNNAISRSFGLQNEEFTIVNGIDEGLRVITTAFLSTEDRVAIPVPSFAMYEFYANIVGASVEKIPLLHPNFTYNLVKYRNTSSKMVIICSPNNPTGTSFPINELVEICLQNPNTIYVLDQAYNFSKKEVLVFRKCPNLLVLRTFSKQYAVAGLRVGFIAGNPQLISEVKKIISPYAVNAVATTILPQLLEISWFDQFSSKISSNRKFLSEQIITRGFDVLPSNANFLLINFDQINSYVNQQLKERGILIRNRDKDPMLKGYSRVTIGSREQMNQFLSALDEVLETPTIIFDMDGVLVDTSMSYATAIIKSILEFTGREISQEVISKIKMNPGYNSDWKTTQRILADLGYDIPLQEIIPVFQKYYSLYFEREKLIPTKNFLGQLASKYRLGIVTGRPREEAMLALERFNIQQLFSVVITIDDVINDKPDPEGINKAMSLLKARESFYIGDTINDIYAASRAGANPVLFPLSDIKCKLKLNNLEDLEVIL